jgi:hypothetical protein
MNKFDFIQFIGSKACSATSKVSEIIVANPTCGNVESWNMGALVLGALAVALTVRIIQERRRRFRETYFG